MKKFLCLGLAATSICIASPKPAEAGGGGFVFGTVLGLGVGTVVGSAIARPYYGPYAPYPYAYYPYPAPYAYAYPPPAYAVPPVSYAPPPGYVAAPPVGQAPAPLRPPVACGPGQFFNTLTRNCDRR